MLLLTAPADLPPELRPRGRAAGIGRDLNCRSDE